MKDPALRSCSIAARGLWMDMLCLMFESDRRGFLQAPSGTPYSPEQLARMTGCSADEVSRLLAELETSGVFSRTAHGTIFSRRLKRDEEQRADHRARQSKHYKLKKIKENADEDMTVDMTQTSQASSTSSSTSSSEQKTKATPRRSVSSAYSPPDWVPKDSWEAFCEMRKKIRAPLTNRAAEQTVRELERLWKIGHDPGDVLDQSVQRGWRGVFEIKTQSGDGNASRNRIQTSTTEQNIAALQRRLSVRPVEPSGEDRSGYDPPHGHAPASSGRSDPVGMVPSAELLFPAATDLGIHPGGADAPSVAIGGKNH